MTLAVSTYLDGIYLVKFRNGREKKIILCKKEACEFFHKVAMQELKSMKLIKEFRV